MTIKPFCSAKQAIAAIEAFTTIIDDGVAPDTISKVVVRVPPPYSRMVAMKPEAGARASTIVSAAFQIGLAAYHRERLYDIERADAMDGNQALVLAGKVEIAADESLLEFFPANFPAEVEVTAGGKTLRKRVTAAAGDPGRALDDAALADKAKRILGGCVGTDDRNRPGRLPKARTPASVSPTRCGQARWIELDKGADSNNVPAAAMTDHPPKPRLTLRVGITGHRPNKLPNADLPRIERQLRDTFARSRRP